MRSTNELRTKHQALLDKAKEQAAQDYIDNPDAELWEAMYRGQAFALWWALYEDVDWDQDDNPVMPK